MKSVQIEVKEFDLNAVIHFSILIADYVKKEKTPPAIVSGLNAKDS